MNQLAFGLHPVLEWVRRLSTAMPIERDEISAERDVVVRRGKNPGDWWL